MWDTPVNSASRSSRDAFKCTAGIVWGSLYAGDLGWTVATDGALRTRLSFDYKVTINGLGMS